MRRNQKVFVGGLSWNITDEDLKAEFAKVAEVKSAKVVLDQQTGRSRGFGFVEFHEDEDLQKVIIAMDQRKLDGRTIRVSEAEDKQRSRG